MKKKSRYYILLGILALIAGINVFFYYIGPEETVSIIGIENTYIVVFLIAAIGGLSAFTGVALFTSLAAFAAGGADPLLLALSGGVGIFISDSIFYFLALYGRRSIPQKWGRVLDRVEKLIEKYPSKVVLAGIYLYISFTPLPNDLLMVALVVAGYSYRKIVWVLLAGSLTIALLTAYLGTTIFS